MRPFISLKQAFTHPPTILSGIVVCLTLAGCSIPDISFSKRPQSEAVNLAFFSKQLAASTVDKKYLTTVHIRFSESKDVSPINFDIRRDKRSMVAAKLWEGDKSKVIMHLGYTRGDGPIIGAHYSWRF